MFRSFCLLIILLGLTITCAYAEQSVFNPDIGVVGELTMQQNASGDYAPAIGEVEMNFSAAVDPLGKAVFTIANGEEGTEIEEAYLKLPELPYGLMGRFGRVKVNFNRLNILHAHAFPFTGQLKYLEDSFGEAGVVKDGFEFSTLCPTIFSYSDFTLAYLGGNTDNSLSGDHPVISTKWNNFLETGDNSGVEMGFSLLDGTGITQDAHTTIVGVNLRVKQQIGSNNSLSWENELLYSNRDLATSIGIGSFHYLGLNVNKQYQIGVGLNRSDLPDGTNYQDTFVTVQYKVTEFQLYKVQYTRDADGNNSICFNLTYFIGPHPVHEF